MSGNKPELEQGMDQLLQEDKAAVQRILNQASDESFAAAVRIGVQKGRQQLKRRKRSRLTLQMATAAACILVLLTACIRVSPAFAELMREIPGLNGVVEMIKGDRTLTSALNHEFLQPVNKSISKNGWTLTFDGIMADQQRIVIFYTKEGPNVNTDIRPSDFKITDQNGKEVIGLINWGPYISGVTESEVNDKTEVHERMDITLSNGMVMPDEIKFSMKHDEDWLEIDVTVDHKRFEEMVEEISINRTFEVSGQRFTLERALITPLQASLTIRREPNEKMRANQFIKMALVDEKGHRWETKGGFGMLDDGTTTLTFQSNYFERPKHLSLVADGLLLSPKGQKFVINTVTGQTLETPDDNIRLKSVHSDLEGVHLTIEASHLDNMEIGYGYWLLEYKGKFSDLSGGIYTIQDYTGGSTMGDGSRSEGTYEAYYTIPNKPYKQPLTFELYQYPGYVEQPVNVAIK
ncbi:hypothetical protein PghCCS26_59460 [Paenibacillus glycanilyticus]|uniref:DUF4179 domain-containing protein n=1 Tax=Paenibacillus glycanilyticus TaxID=126569 RepID=A0ABQ6NUQ1_9BACL|nr:DUF4179 domain-containing protein [Paenibacillus glycanilyticus]GMK48816.1 hypothetical protein PghCCS26_59460 [Paenibacillus glycanilyticus]